MKFRLQYSLLTLLVLTMVCAAVVAYVVVPWRHEKRQNEIIERLKAHDAYHFHISAGDEKGTYNFQHASDDPTTLQFFIDNTDGCDRIHTIQLEYECYNEKQLAKLSQLPKLTKLDLRSNAINEARMQILRELPLKELQFLMWESAAFETWPLQPRLETFRLSYGPDFAAPPLQLKAHPRLRELHIESCPHDVVIESCPELQTLNLYHPYDDASSATLKLKNLPKLESLSLTFENLHPESMIEEFTRLKKLSIRSEIFPLIEKHRLENLTSFRENSFLVTLTPTQVDKILQLPQLEELSLQSNWDDFREGVRIPLMPQLHDLELRVPYTGKGKILVPEEVAIAFIRQSPSLQALKLPLQDVSEKLLQEIATLEQLRYVKLEVRGKIRGDLSVLRQCQKLYQLELDFSELTPEHVAQFNELKQIERLALHHRGEENIDMATLKPRPKLSVLYNHDYYTQNFPVMLPDRKAPLKGFRCNTGMIQVAPAATPPASP